ncbi:hypothetical protein ACFL35_12660 [Candidatus Riflebacteria bacterium]
MPDFITLTCPSCNGKLEITPDMDRFACGYCGNEHIVKRAGGVVQLEAVTQAIHGVKAEVKGVKVGVDKTAAELAIVRLRKEIAELQEKKEKLGPCPPAGMEDTSAARFILGCSGSLAMIGCLYPFSIFFLGWLVWYLGFANTTVGLKIKWLFPSVELAIILIIIGTFGLLVYASIEGGRDLYKTYQNKNKPLEKTLRKKRAQLEENLRIANL